MEGGSLYFTNIAYVVQDHDICLLIFFIGWAEPDLNLYQEVY